MKKKKSIKLRQILKPGSIVAVPRHLSGYYYLVHLTNNCFGESFGLIDGHFLTTDLNESALLKPYRKYVYTDSEYVRKQRWQIIGLRPDLLLYYPEDPEIFHRKSNNVDNPDIGDYGSAENSEGILRSLTEEESKSIPLDSSYQYVLLESEVENFLNRQLN